MANKPQNRRPVPEGVDKKFIKDEPVETLVNEEVEEVVEDTVVKEIVCVTAERLNIRKTPEVKEDNVVKIVSGGDTFVRIADVNGWSTIELDDGTTAYCMSQFLERK